MTARRFLATFHPLVRTVAGRRAAAAHGLAPFVDGSCRREPDFESPIPSISAICRAGNFAPRLRVGDTVAYLTVKGRYTGEPARGWRFVAVLHVIEHFESHDLAAAWYRAQSVPVPNNCIVEGNPPMAFELTHRHPRREILDRGAGNPVRIVKLWDAAYRKRVRDWPVFLACKSSFMALHEPPQLTERDMLKIFGRIPATRTPTTISAREFARLMVMARRAG